MAKLVVSQQYFHSVNPILGFLIISGMYLLTMSVYSPNNIPWMFGPLGALAKFLGESYPSAMRIVLILAVFLHVVESLIAAVICRNLCLDGITTAKWWIQTLAFGLFSLRFLLNDSYMRKDEKVT